ncbi:type IV secretory system conjugative DNA transfer family protein [Spiroplasma melliferum]|uniref:type IV secretory system conjugative DNA transfer family protein n=1 Tax=Spiroplasma melliferum TaxID=2134 RepID=UPI0002A656BF|nr:type IV secretory system conjugative DNA transfer family protein [Spiroplasma melliferum]ELL44223.1 conjugation protein [Spiroplasma melliferum IPMB4A]
MHKSKRFSKHQKDSLIAACVFFPIANIFGTIIISFFKVWKMPGFTFSKFFPYLWKFMSENITFVLICILVISLLFWLIACFIIFVAAKHFEKTYVKKTETSEYGGAKWIVNELDKKGSIKEFNKLYPVHNLHDVKNKAGWVVRFLRKNSKINFNVRGNTHAICLGATNSGKSQKIVMPSAIYNSCLPERYKPCLIFTDPKGELYDVLSKLLQKNGYEVLVLNLRDPKNSSSWNPLAISYKYYYDSVTIAKELKYFIVKNQKHLEKYVCYYHDEFNCAECFRNIVNKKIAIFRNQWFFDLKEAQEFVEATRNELKSLAIEEINDLVLTIWPLTGGENDHFASMAASIAKTIILGLLEILDDNPATLPLEKFNFPLINMLCSDRKKMKAWFASLPSTSLAKIIGANALATGEKELGSIFSTLDRGLQIYQDLGIQSIVCNNEIDLFKFTEKPKALFLIIPDEKTNRHIFASLIISQLYKANVAIATERKSKRLPRDIQFYLDEFGNMPTIPNFQSFVTVARSRGMFFLIIVQDLDQVYEKYGKENGTVIISNCNLNIYIQTNNFDTAKTYSDMLGTETVEILSHSRSRSLQTKRIMIDPVQRRKEGMELIKPSDLMKLKNPYGIIFSSKENPGLVYMDSAWKYSKVFGLGKLKNTKIIKPFNFLNNHYFDLFSYVTSGQVEMMKNEIEEKIATILKIPLAERTPEQIKLLEKCKNIGINVNES